MTLPANMDATNDSRLTQNRISGIELPNYIKDRKIARDHECAAQNVGNSSIGIVRKGLGDRSCVSVHLLFLVLVLHETEPKLDLSHTEKQLTS